MNREYTVIGGTAVVSLAIGAATSWFITKKVLEAKYEDIIESEIAEAKRFYSQLNKKGEFADPSALVKAYEAEINHLGYRDTSTEAVVDQPKISSEKVNNVFDQVHVLSEDFDYEEELKTRSSEEPYVISHDEFYENSDDYSQVTLTYFEEDDVLTDEKDAPITDTDSVVGDKNLTRFGHGSKDNNVVYIRNERISVDFEVVRSKGSYTKEVLGFIEHSDKQGPRRFRRDYE